MLSRRSVRVKVMQILYAMSKDDSLTKKAINKMYWDRIDNSYDLFLFNIYVVRQIAKMAVEDEERRKIKHLPTDYDRAFSDKLNANELVSSLKDHTFLHSEFDVRHFAQSVDIDHFREIYNEFSKTEEYKAYIHKESEKEDHLAILLDLYRFCRQNVLFKEMMEDHFSNWNDDKSMVIGAVKKVIKSLPIYEVADIKQHYPDDETVKEYGEALLNKVIDGEEYLLGLINPMLENWDLERLASIDIILLKMATAEMLSFETIPCKVTINEYVDIAKTYSTEKSKEFVNGVLDRLMKKLDSAGKIEKKNYND